MKRFLSLMLTVLLLCSLCVPALAADSAVGTTLRLSEIKGTVTVKDAAGKDKTARDGMRLYNGYTVETGKSSSVFITLDDTKAVKLDASSKIEIKQNGKKLEVGLSKGQLFFDVAQPLKKDESLSIRTSTMVTGVRGSNGWQNLNGMGMIHGSGDVVCTDESGVSVPTHVGNGEGVFLDPNGTGGGSNAALREIGFAQTLLTNEQVPAGSVELILADPIKQAQLNEVPNLSLQVLTDTLPDKQAAEAAAEAAAAATAEAALKQQSAQMAQTTDYAPLQGVTASQPVTSGGDSGDDDSGSSSSGNPADSRTLMAQLSGGSATLDAGGWMISYSDVTVGAGQTLNITGAGTVSMPNLNIEAGGTVNVGAGSTLAVSGTDLVHRGTLTNNGTVNNSAEIALLGTVINNGTYVNGSILAVAPGASFTGGTVSNTGTVLANGTFSPGACDGVVIRN